MYKQPVACKATNTKNQRWNYCRHLDLYNRFVVEVLLDKEAVYCRWEGNSILDAHALGVPVVLEGPKVENVIANVEAEQRVDQTINGLSRH